jgi:signal transduction histidine kinase
MKLRVWILLVLGLLPFVPLAYLGVQTAVETRRAFADLNASLDTLTEAVRLEGLVRQGIADQISVAREYLARRNEPALQQFTRLSWTTYENEARYLGLSLTSEERLAVERMRTQHRLFEGVLQEAMSRADGRPTPGLDAQVEAAQDASTHALDDVSRMLQERMAQMAGTADAATVHLGQLVTTLAALFVVSLLVLVALALRAIKLQRRLVEAERLAAVSQVGVTLRHEINNPLSVVVGAADILREVSHDPRAVDEWADAVASAAARIRDVLKRLEELREVETVDYIPGVPMVDLKTGPVVVPPSDEPG